MEAVRAARGRHTVREAVGAISGCHTEEEAVGAVRDWGAITKREVVGAVTKVEAVGDVTVHGRGHRKKSQKHPQFPLKQLQTFFTHHRTPYLKYYVQDEKGNTSSPV